MSAVETPTPDDQMTLAATLQGDVPTVLRRAWEDALDDLLRARG